MGGLSSLLRTFLFVSLLVLMTTSHRVSASDAAAKDAMMDESFQQFDQDLHSGWRTFQLEMRYQDAVDAIQRYQHIHAGKLAAWQLASLSFHLAHLYALLDERRQAVAGFRQVLASHLLGNGAYLDAYIAFLQNDRTGLEQARSAIAAMAPGPWRDQDLSEIDAMVRYYGQPFELAFGALNCEPHGSSGVDPAFSGYCSALRKKYGALYRGI